MPSVILILVCPVPLTHKNPQRHKIIKRHVSRTTEFKIDLPI